MDANTLCIVNDGNTRWCAHMTELVAAMDAAGWINTRCATDGRPARREPLGDDATAPYGALCCAVCEQPMPPNPADFEMLEWRPDVDLWVWC